MKIESSVALLTQNADALFQTLSKASAFEQLMPEEASFKMTDEEHFSFKLGGMPVIPLKMTQKIPNSKIILAADGGNVPFELQLNLESTGNSTKVQLIFEGSINPMMQMMVKKPLTQFLEALITNVQKL